MADDADGPAGYVRPEIVVVGSANLDASVHLARLPVPGETVLGGAVAESLGGKGANQAVAAARLGGAVAFVGLVGDDPPGVRIRDSLRAERVDVRHLGTCTDAPTGRAFVVVEDSGENMIVVAPGANGALSAEQVRAAAPLVAGAAALVVQFEIPGRAVAEAVGLAGGLVVMNPSPARPVPADLLGWVDVLVVNRSELASIADAPEPAGPAEAMGLAARLRGPRAVVVTLGGEGALAVSDGLRLQVPAVRAGDVVDPTGAGDTFCGALTEALVRGRGLPDLEDAVRWAVRAAGIAVTAPGAQAAMPTARQVEELG